MTKEIEVVSKEKRIGKDTKKGKDDLLERLRNRMRNDPAFEAKVKKLFGGGGAKDKFVTERFNKMTGKPGRELRSRKERVRYRATERETRNATNKRRLATPEGRLSWEQSEMDLRSLRDQERRQDMDRIKAFNDARREKTGIPNYGARGTSTLPDGETVRGSQPYSGPEGQVSPAVFRYGSDTAGDYGDSGIQPEGQTYPNLVDPVFNAEGQEIAGIGGYPVSQPDPSNVNWLREAALRRQDPQYPR